MGEEPLPIAVELSLLEPLSLPSLPDLCGKKA
jgi:hypothetical protein